MHSSFGVSVRQEGSRGSDYRFRVISCDRCYDSSEDASVECNKIQVRGIELSDEECM